MEIPMKKMERMAEEIIQNAFSGLPANEVRFMVESGNIHSYLEDRVLCRENAVEDTFYIILEGEVKVIKVINHDETRLLKKLTTGDFFGEMALIHDAPRAASVITTKYTTVLEVNRKSFDELLKKSSTIAMLMVKEVSRRLRENDEMAIEDLRMKAGELASAYQKLAEEEMARREFLSTVAHELRTPLTSANGFVEMARRGLLEGDMLKSSLATVSNNLQQITVLINDILFLQEIDFILSDFAPVDLGKVIVSAADSLREKAANNGIGLDINIPAYLPPISGDERILKKAFEAVLDNAIKFSPDGGEVVINARIDNDFISVEVIDPGVGIPEEVINHIFERFYRLDTVGEHIFSGVGLGLAIVKQVIDQHAGKITVESQFGVGTKFIMQFTR